MKVRKMLLHEFSTLLVLKNYEYDVEETGWINRQEQQKLWALQLVWNYWKSFIAIRFLSWIWETLTNAAPTHLEQLLTKTFTEMLRFRSLAWTKWSS